MGNICIKARVRGRVQGVWFRASTEEQAEFRGVTGWAKNLADGSIEVMLCGASAEVEAVRDWLYKGPPMAHVIDVRWERQPYREILGFLTD